MAVVDDLKRLADLDVVYLTQSFVAFEGWPRVVYRGRLRQSLGGEWLFFASTDQNGVLGFGLGLPTGTWSSSETPRTGIRVNAMFPFSVQPPTGILNVCIELSSVFPAEFAD